MIKNNIWGPHSDWCLMVTLGGYHHLHAYVLPPGFENISEILSLEEMGNENFMTPNGLRQWYEKPSDSVNYHPSSHMKLSVKVNSDGDSSDRTLSPVKWREEGYGCAVVTIKPNDIQQQSLIVQLYAGAFILAETRLPSEFYLEHSRRDEIDSRFTLVPYHTGGDRIVSRSQAFSKIFASYAREDIKVVETAESILRVLGSVDFRWDLRILQAGDRWENILLREIEQADSFQLFWSKHAKVSKNVRHEWRYALKLKREHFIKPVYWNEPMPKPPKELGHIHFSLIQLSQS
jgi:TIR domain